ncbi:hypothetical protein FB451DRAFT_1262453 [Mycena latifolia]|nr:hypothetical protein FB451DRAFT_1262453 [Mycena latifolia]
MASIRSSLASSQSGSSLSVADTVTSTTALTAAHRPPQKDYAAAFASLQEQYGTSGDFPGRAVAQPKKKQPQHKPASSAATPSTSASRHAQNPASRASPTLATVSENAPEASTPKVAQDTEADKRKVSKLKKLFSVRLKKRCPSRVLSLCHLLTTAARALQVINDAAPWPSRVSVAVLFTCHRQSQFLRHSRLVSCLR